MRRLFDVREPIVNDVLKGPENPNLEIFRQIQRPIPPVLFDFEPGKVSFNTVVTTVGYETLHKQCGFDIVRFRSLVKHLFGASRATKSLALGKCCAGLPKAGG